jgi:hypothetical protein
VGYREVGFTFKNRHCQTGPVGPFRARSRLIKWCAKAVRQYDYDSVLSFHGVARDVSFPVRILDENGFSRRKASHLSVARFKFHVAIQPYGEESFRRPVKTHFAHPGGDVRKTDA